MCLHASVILGMHRERLVTASKAGAASTGKARMPNAALGAGTWFSFRMASALPQTLTPHALKGQIAASVARNAHPLATPNLRHNALIRTSKPSFHASDRSPQFRELNRQIQELEPCVTHRKELTTPRSNRQKTQKRCSEFSTCFVFGKAPPTPPGNRQPRLNEVLCP